MGANQFQGSAAQPFGGGTDVVIYQEIEVHQNKGTTCVFDWVERLALGAHLYPGSSLQSYMFPGSGLSGSKKTLSIPVNQILPQSLSKTMTATQDMTIPWSVTKSATPASLTLKDTCDPSSALSQPVAITITWKKLAALPTGGVSIETIVSATNPSARTITVNVFDQIYGGATGTANPLERDPSPSGTIAVDVPPNTTIPVLTHDFIDNSGLYTAYNDVATATYTDKVTGVAVPGQTTANASATVQAGTTANATATIHDDENISGSTLEFSVDTTDPAQPYGTFSCTLGAATKTCGWDSPLLSAGGSVKFNKTVYIPAKNS